MTMCPTNNESRRLDPALLNKLTSFSQSGHKYLWSNTWSSFRLVSFHTLSSFCTRLKALQKVEWSTTKDINLACSATLRGLFSTEVWFLVWKWNIKILDYRKITSPKVNFAEIFTAYICRKLKYLRGDICTLSLCTFWIDKVRILPRTCIRDVLILDSQ